MGLFKYRCLGCGANTRQACVRCSEYISQIQPPYCADALVAFEFEGTVRNLIIGFKYRNHRAVAAMLATCLVKNVQDIVASEQLDVITWIPTTRKRKMSRGHDQAETLARCVGKALHLPVRPLLNRISQQHQTGHGRSQRLDGVRFRSRSIGRYSRILVIDDVVTTGATMRMARHSLMMAGATNVVCAAVAATPARGTRG